MVTIKAHDGNKIALTLSVGKLSLAVVLEWESKALAFFTKQKIPLADQVFEILGCFKDQRIIGWIVKSHAMLTGEDYNFTAFMKKFRDLFLDPDWEYHIIHSVLNAKMNPNDLFSSYTNHVITRNNLLWGTNSCLDNAGLKNTLTINMLEPLAIHLMSLPELK